MTDYKQEWFKEVEQTNISKWSETDKKSVKKLAIDFLNQESIRRLSPEKFNALVNRVKLLLESQLLEKAKLRDKMELEKNDIIKLTNEQLVEEVNYYELQQEINVQQRKEMFEMGRNIKILPDKKEIKKPLTEAEIKAEIQQDINDDLKKDMEETEKDIKIIPDNEVPKNKEKTNSKKTKTKIA